MARLDRRRFMTSATQAALAQSLFAGAIERALAIPAARRSGALEDVEYRHVLRSVRPD